MTLSIMENHDAIKVALKDYQNTTGEIPKVLDRYLEYVARTGKPLFSWDLISNLIIKKFENVFDDFGVDKSIQNVKTINNDNATAHSLKQECLQAIATLTGVPFTIQRICELLLNPKKNYTKLEKFLRGFLRVIKVVTTVDRIGQKITTESQLFANAMSPFEVNESGDNWSGFSSQSDDSLVHIQMQSPDNNLLDDPKQSIDFIDEKTPQPVTVCLSSGPSDSYATKMIDQGQQTSDSIYPNNEQQYFMEQKTIISMPPIGALFKPIDQLEAFVQNVSNQVESSSSSSSTPPKIEDTKKRTADESVDCLTAESPCSSLDEHLGNDFVSQVKKRKLDIVSQEAVISSTEVMSEEIPTKDEAQISEIETGLPTVSSQANLCAEEPSSSTNEIKPNSNSIVNSAIIGPIKPNDDDELLCCYSAVDDGNCSTNQAVEADQSNNCDDDDNDSNSIDPMPIDENNCANDDDEEEEADDGNGSRTESVSDKESNSIDEETGEHV